MKKIYRIIKDYVSSHFHVKLYAAVIMYLIILISFNYLLDFEDTYIDRYYGHNIRILFLSAIHVVGYVPVLIIAAVATGRKDFLSSRAFWIKCLLGFLILGFDRSFHYHRALKDVLASEIYIFVYKWVKNALGLLTIILPLAIIYLWHDRKFIDSFYGLKFKNVNLRAYWIMLGIMVIILFAGSFIPEINEYYPVYKRSTGDRFAQYFSIAEWHAILIYESAYLFDFVSTELFFRGFLIIGMVRYLGKDAVLPMAVTYTVFHFGKPLGETISSFFGGYILGTLALYTRNIWGGVFIHMGVALFMEIFGFLQMWLRSAE